MKALMNEEVLYGPHWYDVDKRALAELKVLKPHKPVIAALVNFGLLAVFVKAYLLLQSPLLYILYPVIMFLMAGRAGVFLQLAHEAAHGLVAEGKFNDWFGNWMACYPIGLDLKGYQEPHMRHHACTNQICDPLSDTEKYRICELRNPKLWLLFLKDLVGITAISIRLMYDRKLANQPKEAIEDYVETVTLGQKIMKFASIALVQILILGMVFSFNAIHYALLWILPMVTAHMFLMRVRGIAEHGLAIQLGVTNLEKKTRGTFFTRSFGTPMNHYSFQLFNWIERLLIGSLDVYYHHEHHLYPKVPYYNLGKAHLLIASRVKKNNPAVFAKGYFACLVYNWARNQKIPCPKPNFP
ncbi:MAG TPA: fatty acid desaturase [Candidatus Paceibacterota bacterium]